MVFRLLSVVLLFFVSDLAAEAPETSRPDLVLEKLSIGQISPHSTERPELVFKSSALPSAYAIAPNKVVISSGLLDLAQDEDEVAFIIAHEIAHLKLGHSTQGKTANEALIQELEADREALLMLKKAGFEVNGTSPLLFRIAGLHTPDGTRLGALYPVLDLRASSLVLPSFL